MSFLSNLFSPPPPPKIEQPQLPPPVPRISDATIEAADREASARLRARKGLDQATLADVGLGDSTRAPSATLQRATLLGGAGTV